MAMYRHVRERKDLLEAVVDRLMGSLSSKPSVPWLRPPLRSVEAVDPFLATLSGSASATSRQ